MKAFNEIRTENEKAIVNGTEQEYKKAFDDAVEEYLKQLFTQTYRSNYMPIIDSTTIIPLTNRVRISASDGNVYEGDIASNDDGMITIRLDSGELKLIDCIPD